MGERERTAHHEAAHAVAALRFGHDCYGVHIIPHGDNAGSTDGEGTWWDLKSAQETIIGLYAGYCAAAKLDPDSEPEARSGASLDFEQAEEILQKIGETDTEVYISRARAFVESNWEQIRMVASELLEYESLDNTELEILIDIADGKDQMDSLANYRALRDAR